MPIAPLLLLLLLLFAPLCARAAVAASVKFTPSACSAVLTLHQQTRDFSPSRNRLLYSGIAHVYDGTLVLGESASSRKHVRVHVVLRRVSTHPTRVVVANERDSRRASFKLQATRRNSCVYRTTTNAEATHEIEISGMERNISVLNRKQIVVIKRTSQQSIWIWLAPILVIAAVSIACICSIAYWCSKRRSTGPRDNHSDIPVEYGGRRMSQTWIPAMSNRLSQSFVGLRVGSNVHAPQPPPPPPPTAPLPPVPPPETKVSVNTSSADTMTIEVGSDEIQPARKN